MYLWWCVCAMLASGFVNINNNSKSAQERERERETERERDRERESFFASNVGQGSSLDWTGPDRTVYTQLQQECQHEAIKAKRIDRQPTTTTTNNN